MLDEDGTPTILGRDTGIGMSQEEIPIALEPFRKIDGRLSRKYEGTGLGLPLTKRLVELHDGTLAIESEPGEGTTVTIKFPIARAILTNRALIDGQVVS